MALGRLRFVIVTACWLIALSLVTQLVIWSLCTFTDLRYSSELATDGDTALVAPSKADRRND